MKNIKRPVTFLLLVIFFISTVVPSFVLARPDTVEYTKVATEVTTEIHDKCHHSDDKIAEIIGNNILSDECCDLFCHCLDMHCHGAHVLASTLFIPPMFVPTDNQITAAYFQVNSGFNEKIKRPPKA